MDLSKLLYVTTLFGFIVVVSLGFSIFHSWPARIEESISMGFIKLIPMEFNVSITLSYFIFIFEVYFDIHFPKKVMPKSMFFPIKFSKFLVCIIIFICLWKSFNVIIKFGAI